MARRKAHAAEATESGPEPISPAVDEVVQHATHQAEQKPTGDVFDAGIAALQQSAAQAVNDAVHHQAVHAVESVQHHPVRTGRRGRGRVRVSNCGASPRV